MFKQLYRYWFLVPLIIVAILARDWVEDPTGLELEDTIDMSSTRADYYLEKFTTRKLDRFGKPEYILTGDTLTHYPADDSSEIVLPQLTLHHPDGIWKLDSRQGRLTTDPDIFTLAGTVTMTRQATDNTEGLTIATSDLKIHTVTRVVETDQPIEVVSSNWTLKSVGLQSNINEGILTLMSDVEGHYEINR
ncbi:MAG: LPS export ABC transporter periplasmic protein LptC [Gammaproteobacteria bacterium]|nr:LPS export ABC transporter periplasmic protein LptC [Gammaproteobacteria bacterium]